VYDGVMGGELLRRSLESRMDPGIAAFAASVTRSSNMPASYVNAASVSR